MAYQYFVGVFYIPCASPIGIDTGLARETTQNSSMCQAEMAEKERARDQSIFPGRTDTTDVMGSVPVEDDSRGEKESVTVEKNGSILVCFGEITCLRLLCTDLF